MKVLYADDDIQVRDYVSMLLEAGLDCEILEASSGNEALSILEFDSEVDFVITEVRMKGGNGNVIVDYLDHHNLNIPIVWLSEPENKEVMLVQEVLARSPLNAFVGKPFRDDQFFPVIDKILSLKAEYIEDLNSSEASLESEDEDVEFDDDDFNFGDEFEPKDTDSDSKNNPFRNLDEEASDKKSSSSEDDWSYGFKKKKQLGEEELDYSLKKNKGAEEEAGYSLKKEFSSQEEDAGYSLKQDSNAREEGAGYSLKKEFGQAGEDELDFRGEKNHSEEELSLDIEKRKKAELASKKAKEEKSSDAKDDYDRERFKRVKLKRFLNFTEICCDVYLKMNVKKYLKVINSSEEYSQEMITKYRDKGITYLYVEKEDYTSFSEQFGNLVMDRLEKAKSLPEEVRGVVELAAFEHTMESAKELGVTQATANKVRQSVKANMAALTKMPKLEGLLNRIMRGGDYLSEHSLLLSYVAGQICMATSWGNPQTLEKLSMAAMFHDIALEKNQWARFHTIEQAKEAGLSDSEVESIKAHPGLAAKLISEGEHIFADVDSIIMQHHELPDKNGFPRGLGALSISPLSCIFIIASEFVEEVYGKPSSAIDIESIKAKFSDKFSKGNFKKPLEAFLKVF